MARVISSAMVKAEAKADEIFIREQKDGRFAVESWDGAEAWPLSGPYDTEAEAQTAAAEAEGQR